MEGRKHKYQMANDPEFPLCGVCCVSPHETFTSVGLVLFGDKAKWESFFKMSKTENEQKWEK